jgi:hypothetical protein
VHIPYFQEEKRMKKSQADQGIIPNLRIRSLAVDRICGSPRKISKNNVQIVHRNSTAAVQSYGSMDNDKEKEFLDEELKMELSKLELLCKERNVKWM